MHVKPSFLLRKENRQKNKSLVVLLGIHKIFFVFNKEVEIPFSSLLQVICCMLKAIRLLLLIERRVELLKSSSCNLETIFARKYIFYAFQSIRRINLKKKDFFGES